MGKKIEILGIGVDNYTVREALLRLDTYLGSTAFNIIETVTMKQLILAGENPEIKDCLMQADLCVIGEREILSEAGCASAQRLREIRNQDFLRELLRRVSRSKKRVFLIASADVDLERMRAFLAEACPGFASIGEYAAESCDGDIDDIVNEINGATPDIVISGMESPKEEEFLLSNREKIGASLWYGLGCGYGEKPGVAKVGGILKSLALRGRLRHSVTKYQNEMRERS